MANKKISELLSRTPSLTDLMLVGDPSSGYSYKCTVNDVATIVDTAISGNYVNITGTQTVSGAKTFSNILTLTSVANSPTTASKFLILNATNVVNYRTGAEVLSDIGAQGALTLTTTGSSGAATLVGNTLNIPNYGSALSGYVPTSRTLTINGTAYDLSADRTWSVGTVTSVAMTVPTGLTVAGTPITTNGTLAISLQSGYSIPTTASQTNWDAAYNDKINSAAVTGTTTKTLTLTQQDGGTVTASWTDLNTGTVTSVGLSAPTGFTVTNSPVTSSGTLTLAFATGYSLPTNASQTNWDTAYTNRITSLTTTGSSGAATLISNTLNIPNYTLSGLGGVPTSRTLTINGTALDLSADRSWSVGTVTSVAALTIGTTGTDITSTVATGTTTPVITLNVPTASATNRGALSSTDWSTFNNKQNAITLTTTGTSGAATLVGSTLNIPQYQAALTNPVTGTGTTNYLSKFTGTSTIGNSQVFDNGTNVGIGTATPGALLTLGSGYSMEMNVNSSTPRIDLVDNNVYTGTFYTNGGLVTIANSSNNALRFSTNGSERMRITSAGQVLIGATTPYGTENLLIQTASDAFQSFRNTAGTTQVLNIGTYSAGHHYIGGLGAYPLLLATNGSERMRISSAGLVSVGTNSGTERLNVNGAIAISGAGTAAQTSAGLIDFNNGRLNLSSFGAVGTAGEISFFTATGGVSATERMRLTGAGNLGINTSSPSYPLDVSGNARIYTTGTGGLILEATSGSETPNLIFLSTTNRYNLDNFSGSLRFFREDINGTNGVVRMTLTDGGNLGLGVTPSAWNSGAKALQVSNAGLYASTNFTNLGSNIVWLSTGNAYISNGFASLYAQESGEHRWSTAPSGTAGNAITFTQAMTLDASGNLGVGVTSPARQIDINGNLRIRSGAIDLSNDFNNQLYSLSSSFYIKTNGSDRMVVTSSGNVGIGTTAPETPLHVFGSTAGLLVIGGTGATAKQTIIGHVSTGNGYTSIQSVFQNTGFTPIALNPSGGNVGIGVTSPAANLSLSGSADVGMRIKAGSANLSYIDFDNADSGTPNGSIAYNHGNNAMTFATGGSNGEKMRITSGGTVMIGTTTGGGDKLAISQSGANWAQTINHTNATQYQIEFRYNGTAIGSITGNGSATAYNTTSDYRLKKDLKDFNGLNLVSAIKVYDYQWKADSTRSYGVMAHELQTVLPYAVTGVKDGETLQGVDYSKIVPLLVKAIQEQQIEIENLKNK